MDGFLNFSKNQVKYVFAIFQYLLVNSLFIKVEKFLGYIVAEWSIQLDSAKISTITSWSVPDSHKQSQRFL